KLPANTFDPSRIAASTISTGAGSPGPVRVSLTVGPFASSPTEKTSNARTRRRGMAMPFAGAGLKTGGYRYDNSPEIALKMTSASWRTIGDTSPVSRVVATVTGSVNSSQMTAAAITTATPPMTTPKPTTRSIPSRGSASESGSAGGTGLPSAQAYIWTGSSSGS